MYLLQRNAGGKGPELKVCQVIDVGEPQTVMGNPFETRLKVLVNDGTGEWRLEGLKGMMTIQELPEMGIVVSDSKELMSTEVDNMMKASKQALDTMPYHKAVVENGAQIMETLNPPSEKEVAQAQKIARLEDGLNGVTEQIQKTDGKIDSIMRMLTAMNKK